VSSRALRFTLLLAACGAFSGQAAFANWIASGTFKYQDREFNASGFTGVEPSRPIRLATVEVRDANKSGGQAILATTATDINGNFAVTVVDSSTRTIAFRVLSDSSAVAGLFLEVTNVNGQVNNYAVTSPNFPNHGPTVNLSMGTVTGMIGAGGEPFNIYDVALNSMMFLRDLNGIYPDSANNLLLEWEPFSGVTATNFLSTGLIQVGDPSAYNDTVIQHESGHYARKVYSATDSPGGIHHLTNCNQDLRLAWEEGWATFFGQAVRLHFDLPNPQLYVKTTGQAGPGHLDFYFDVEQEAPYACDGSASEVVVYAALWDLIDSAATPDASPGEEDASDWMAAPESSVWDVMKNYIRTATNRTLEDFWDGWFMQGEGFATQIRDVFANQVVQFYEDADEPNETPALAKPFPTTGLLVRKTYFKNAGNGAGTVDADYYAFEARAGTTYTIETQNLIGDANTSLILYRSDGVTQLAANDDRSPGIKSSFISFLAPQDGTYYIKSFHSTGYGIYGSYDLAVYANIYTVGGGALRSIAPLPKPVTTPQIN
jgi:pre-peptidase